MNPNPATRRRRVRIAAIGAAVMIATLAVATSVVAATRHTHSAKAARTATVTAITFRAHEVIKPKLRLHEHKGSKENNIVIKFAELANGCRGRRNV